MQRRRAFTLIELLTVIAIIGVLAALLGTALASAKRKSLRTACLSNLHQIGVGFTSFSLDHEGKYPMQIPARLDGSMDYNATNVIENTDFSRDFHHFAALSNQVPNVRVMICPADRRKPSSNYATFTDENLSYWVNPFATPHATLSMLAGDRNLTTITNSNAPVASFTREMHRHQGSVLFADGRVELTRSFAFNRVPEPEKENLMAATPAPIQTSASTEPKRLVGAGGKTNREPAMTNYRSEYSVQKKPRISSAIPETEKTPEPPKADNPRLQPTLKKPVKTPDDEPWDTPGFRLFKFLAVTSYSISLLWAILALVALYLKSRLDQRRKEKASALDQT